MPIYEYRCRDCGETRETLRAVDEADAPLECACGRTDTVRLPSLIARGGADGGLPMTGSGGGCCGGGACGCGH